MKHRLLKSYILSVAAVAAILFATPAVSDDVFVVNLGTLERNTGRTASNTAAIVGNTARTASNTAGALTILQRNFGYLGEGYTNALLSDIKGKLESQMEMSNAQEDLARDNDFIRAKGEQAAITDRETRMYRQSLIMMCRAATAAKNNERGEKITQAARVQISGSGSTKDSTSTDGTVNKEARAARSKRDYCSQLDVDLNRCDGDVSDIPNADVKAATLFVGAPVVTEEYEIVRSPRDGRFIGVRSVTVTPDEDVGDRLTYTEKDIAAAQAYIENAYRPEPDKMPDPEMQNSPQFLEYFAKFIARLSRSAMASWPAEKALADRTPSLDVAEWKRMLDADIKRLSLSDEQAQSASAGLGYDGIDANMLVDGKMSLADKLYHDVKRRYENPAYYSELAGMSAGEHRFEDTMINVLQLKLQYESLETLNEMHALLGTMLANDLQPVTTKDLEDSSPVDR